MNDHALMIGRQITVLVKQARDAQITGDSGSRTDAFNQGFANATANIIADLGFIEWNGNTQDTLTRFIAAYGAEPVPIRTTLSAWGQEAQEQLKRQRTWQEITDREWAQQ